MGSIEVAHLTKWYTPGSPVLDDVSFREEGFGAVGDLGPNGAGKTTTLKLLSGCSYPPPVRRDCNGLDPTRDRRRAMAARRGNRREPRTVSIRDRLRCLRTGRCAPGPRPDGIDDEIDRVPAANCTSPHWSGAVAGCRKESVSGSSWLPPASGTPVLLLDEPTNGMDPAERVEARGFLKRLKRDHLILMSASDRRRLGDLRPLDLPSTAKTRLRASADEVASLVRVDAVDVGVRSSDRARGARGTPAVGPQNRSGSATVGTGSDSTRPGDAVELLRGVRTSRPPPELHALRSRT